MARKCKDCGAVLSSHNPGLLCWPCQERKKKQLQGQIDDTPHYTVDDLCFLLGFANHESVKRLGRKDKIPGRVPEIRQHLYLREEVDRWIHRDRQKEPTEAITAQEPYVETLHKKKMRKLAKALAKTISLPSPMMKDLWRDLPVDLQSGTYSLPIGVVEIDKDKLIEVSYYDIGAGIAKPHLVNWLHSHLSTSGLPKFTELVGDKGELNILSDKAGQYSQAVLLFLQLIADEVKGYRAKVKFHDELKPGLTKWFIVTAWNDALTKASGYYWIDDSWYKPHESIPGTNLWQLKCGSYGIAIAKTSRTLKTYENWHKRLRGNYAGHKSVKDICAKSQEMSNIAQDIRQLLQEFSDIEHLPGHCEFC